MVRRFIFVHSFRGTESITFAKARWQKQETGESHCDHTQEAREQEVGLGYETTRPAPITHFWQGSDSLRVHSLPKQHYQLRSKGSNSQVCRG